MPQPDKDMRAKAAENITRFDKVGMFPQLWQRKEDVPLPGVRVKPRPAKRPLRGSAVLSDSAYESLLLREGSQSARDWLHEEKMVEIELFGAPLRSGSSATSDVSAASGRHSPLSQFRADVLVKRRRENRELQDLPTTLSPAISTSSIHTARQEGSHTSREKRARKPVPANKRPPFMPTNRRITLNRDPGTVFTGTPYDAPLQAERAITRESKARQLGPAFYGTTPSLAKDTIAVDYYLNSAGANVKAAERQMVREQGRRQLEELTRRHREEVSARAKTMAGVGFT